MVTASSEAAVCLDVFEGSQSLKTARIPATPIANPTKNNARSTQTVPYIAVVPSISEARVPTTASQTPIVVDVINDGVTADTAKTPSTSTKSPSTNAITGTPMTITTNAVPRQPA